mmetsp:Transcript_17778/g.38781  ORF Transcript_17778/g.38781 Transcript_17778/m.38781 type:complete len:327 (-) Transcript_17778:629-1609(-)|eukprot:CAMPEP_0118955714 /NCGR_PEP_ID=MMETSP1169-20130426/60392_1 /TAXON_ID=36882 /ORGANISM="Pyramimonas obovata, Strain CCMP722" /LENGTH=326 /DNA_ID=CAMNT_0006903615 /DNA_START=62 /DNA_END=1042 /DNA_ORIENTATION=-
MSTPKANKKPVPEAYKLRVERSDASAKAQYSLLAVAQASVMDILNGTVEIAPGKTWKQGTLAGSKWDVAALQCLTDLLLKRLQGTVHCIAGGEFSTTVRYAKQTLIILSSPTIRLLFYKPVPASARSQTPQTPPTLDQASISSSSIKVIESLTLDEEAMDVAKACLGDEASVDDAVSMDTEASAHASALKRAVRLRDAMNLARGPQWHVIFDKQPFAASIPTPTRMTLQRGKYTFIAFQHAAEEPSLIELAHMNPTLCKVALAVILVLAYYGYRTTCPTVTSAWAVKWCGKVEANMQYILFAIVMVFVYSRLMTAVSKLKAKRKTS